MFEKFIVISFIWYEEIIPKNHRTTQHVQPVEHTLKRGGVMKKLEIVSMVYINGEWKNQDDIPPDDFKSLLASKMDESMRNIGFKRKSAA